MKCYIPYIYIPTHDSQNTLKKTNLKNIKKAINHVIAAFKIIKTKCLDSRRCNTERYITSRKVEDKHLHAIFARTYIKITYGIV